MPSTRVALLIAASAMLCGGVEAHNSDSSYLRCVVKKHSLDVRFTFDIATIFRIVRPDYDNDGRVTRGELDRAAPQIFHYIEDYVHLEINGQPAKFGARGAVGWPPDAGDAIAEKDYHQRLVHFPFHLDSVPVIEDFALSYDVFEEFGDRHRAVSDIEQDGKHLEVAFSLFEPDYLYDTGWKTESPAPVPPATPVPSRIRFRLFVAELWSRSLLMVLIALVAAVVRSRRLFVVSLCALFCLSWGSCVVRCNFAEGVPWNIAAFASVTAVVIAGLSLYPVRILGEIVRRRTQK